MITIGQFWTANLLDCHYCGDGEERLPGESAASFYDRASALHAGCVRAARRRLNPDPPHWSC